MKTFRINYKIGSSDEIKAMRIEANSMREAQNIFWLKPFIIQHSKPVSIVDINETDTLSMRRIIQETATIVSRYNTLREAASAAEKALNNFHFATFSDTITPEEKAIIREAQKIVSHVADMHTDTDAKEYVINYLQDL